MGKIEDDKYTSAEDKNSQVRSIINQLNSDRPSSEKSREVVVRADGTKAVRVVKKRKVMVTNEEKARRGRRKFVYGLLVFLLFVGLVVGALAYRMASMSTESYFKGVESKICQAMGAESVRLVGGRMDGLNLMIDNLVAEFPEDSMVVRAELSELKCELDTSSFFTGILKTSEVQAARAAVTIRSGAEKLDVPTWKGEEVWNISRVVCDNFSVRVDDPVAAPVAIEGSSAYMYFSGASRNSRVVIFDGGMLQIKGWKPMSIIDGKVLVTSVSIEDIRILATTETVREKGKTPESYMEICGSIAQGESLSKQLMVDAVNMNFADFSEGRFVNFVTARTAATAIGKNKPTSYISLPFSAERPSFRGMFALKDVRFTAMPAMLDIIEHIEPGKRNAYMPPRLNSGKLTLENAEGVVTLAFGDEDMRELDTLALRGSVSVNASNELSGTIDYGIPAILTHVEYPDGKADPLFKDDGVLAWVSTKISGFANAPADNGDELEAQAAVLRKDRPQRTPFNDIDVDALSSQLLGKSSGEAKPGTADNSSYTLGEGKKNDASLDDMPANNSGNPFEKKKNPFEADNPFGDSSSNGGLLAPVDKSVFPGL